MSTDLARLQIRVQSLEAQVADKRLKGLAGSGAKAERATDGVTSAFKRFIGPAAAAAAAVASLRKTVSITREFEVLNAQLITATGSAESAGVAFEAIQDFASNTPYDLQQVTESFTKLVNLGLTPSEKALTSYGNTASAMGKDLNQLIEAVADAATGEFERLKEFGIKARSQGDQVSFTFRGVTTTVQKNAAEIEEYLMALGENEFAGAMAQRMDTLDGAISNLNDEWNKLWLNISQQGPGEVIEDAVRLAIDAITELNHMLASGELEANIKGVGMLFTGIGEDISDTLVILQGLWDEFVKYIDDNTGVSVNNIIAEFKNIVPNIRAFVQLLVTEWVDFYAKLYTRTKGFAASVKAIFTDDTVAGVIERTNQQLANLDAARDLSIEAILAERDAAVNSANEQFKAADDLRKKYDEANEARKKANEGVDRLAGFGQGATQQGPTEAEVKAREKLTKSYNDTIEALREEIMLLGVTEKEAFVYEAGAKLAEGATVDMKNSVQELAASLYDLQKGLEDQEAFKALAESLRTEEEQIADSYKKRYDIIIANTAETSEARANLLKRLNDEFATDALGDLAPEENPDTFQEQVDQLNAYYEQRRELILNNVALTEQQRTELETQLTEERNERLKQLEDARMSSILQGGEKLFGGLAGLAKNFAGEQSGIYKAMFAASKAFAIADAIIKIQQGIANAAALPWPANLGAMASVASATGSIVSTISGTNYSGAYDEGGKIPSGKFGIVGEYGPEIVNGPAHVTGREDTAKLMKEMRDGKGGSEPQAQGRQTIINVVDPSMVSDVLSSAAGEDIIWNTVSSNPERLKQVIGG